MSEHPIILGSSSRIYIYEKRTLRDDAELNMTLHEYYRSSRFHPHRLDSQEQFIVIVRMSRLSYYK